MSRTGSPKRLASSSASAKSSCKTEEPCPEVPEASVASSNFPVVAIGASAGGLEALILLISNLGPNTGMAYVVVQHLDPTHKSMLVELLARRSPIPVQEVHGKTKIEADNIYVIPPNRNMFLEKSFLCLCPRGRSRLREMPIDYLFRTVALDQPGNCIGAILSGTGSDGSLGIEEIKAAGGITFAQDLQSAKFDGMPRFAVSTGCVDYVLNPEAIATELKRIGSHPFTCNRRIAELSEENLLLRIFTLLKGRTSVDFRHYKQNTIKRRIFRRMALLKIESLTEYVNNLSKNQSELDALYQDLLIKVTCFFREPASFKALQDDIFPRILKGRNREDPIRMWIPACSTGEEVYSLAIVLMESLGDRASSMPIQIFGTDVSEEALKKARAGIYIENIALDVSSERIRRWFNRVDRGFQICKQIRDMCIFARQNVVTDPPFSKMDLISCRNLLIYFDTVFQRKVMPIFHYALKPEGYLMLGNSESTGSHFDLFSLVDKKAKIYSAKLNSHSAHMSFKKTAFPEPTDQPSAETRKVPNVQQEADQFVVERFAPPGVIVNDDLKIIQFRGSTGDYLEPAPGRASLSLIKMARGNLGSELRPLIHRARNSGQPVTNQRFRYQPRNSISREIALEVAPLKTETPGQFHFLVLFEELSGVAAATIPLSEIREESSVDADIAVLRRELAEAKNNLQSTIEDSEATTEELKSANEEIMSSNEELQSTNEELETAKEELQSTNEELTTVNEEVQSRNRDLSQLNSDLTNFLASVNIPVVMLGTDLKIRRFTPPTQRIFNLLPMDVGRSFGDIKTRVHVQHLDKKILQVIDSVTTYEQEVTDDEGRYYKMSIRPYRTQDNKIEGAVLVFQDIDSIRRSVVELEEAKAYSEGIVEAVMDPLLVLDGSLTVQQANSAYYAFFKTRKEEVARHSIFRLDKGQWDQKELRALLKKFLKQGKKVAPFELTASFSRIGSKTFLVSLQRIVRKNSGSKLMLMALTDITARKVAEKERALLHDQLEKEKSLFEAILQHAHIGVAIFSAPDGKLLLANDHLASILRWKIPARASISSFHALAAFQANGSRMAANDWPMKQALDHGKSIEEKEILLQKSKSSQVHVLVSSTPVFNSKGAILAVVALFTDITERVEIQNQIVEVSSREQRRIAHELHDGVAQKLAAIGYRLKALKVKLGPLKNGEAKDATEISKLVESTLSRSRDLARFLLPVEMDSRGLMHSLKELCATSARLYEVDCVFKCNKPVLVHNPEASLAAFRIAQEAIHNAIKHGKPKRIIVHLQVLRQIVKMSISNDGTDFPLKPRKGRKGMGIQIMRYRAGIIHGELHVAKQNPRGTLLTCTFKP